MGRNERAGRDGGEVDADPTLMQTVAQVASARLAEFVADPDVVFHCVSPGLVAAILGTGTSMTLGLEEAYRQYCMRLAANGSVITVFYVVPMLKAAVAALGLT
jgi:hypothetical protein